MDDRKSSHPPQVLAQPPAPDIEWAALPSPCYMVDEKLLVRNLELLREVANAAGCRILLAQKAFSMYSLYPLIGSYLSGASASSLNEARLASEEMGKEVHICSPAYREDEFDEISGICSHIVFNSFYQWRKYRAASKSVQCGMRINPGYSEINADIYNPCAPFSRLGVPYGEFLLEESQLEGLSGLHFHTLCEQNSDVLERTLMVVKKKFSRYLRRFQWVNFGGGHHITRSDYDIEKLVHCIRDFSEEFGSTVYLEPGEAVALNAGFFVSTVLDIVENGMKIAIMDGSAVCHMPDVLEAPYRPYIISGADPPGSADPFGGAGQSNGAEPHSGAAAGAGGFPYIYRLGGPTCLSGDVIGDYAFDKPLTPGDRLVFTDMAHYTMVKNNTFNGIGLPPIMLYASDGTLKTIRVFGYEDFKRRLS